MEIELINVNCYTLDKYLKNLNCKIDKGIIVGVIGNNTKMLLELLSLKYKVEGVINYNSLKSQTDISYIPVDINKQIIFKSLQEHLNYLKHEYSFDQNKIIKLLKAVGLDISYLNRNIKYLSYGEKKLIQLAEGLLFNPKLIILDNYFLGLDNKNSKKVMKILKKLNNQYHKTVVISSNNNNLLYEFTDKIVAVFENTIDRYSDTNEIFVDKEYLEKHKIETPEIIKFIDLARQKKVKLSYNKDIKDLIKDIYKHV